jgi:2-amino-4-hydroxy-6-hydroxymethyldihydropteridine diphosphokinase
MATLYLGLGSNIEPARHLKLAVAELRRRFSGVYTSVAYRNAPVGFEGADFLNVVARAETDLSVAKVVDELEAIHQLAGRIRRDGVASRELDIDLLLYDRLVLPRDTRIELPRRDVLACDFVLRPLSELAPDYVHPVTGRRLADHWAELAPAGRAMHREALDL